MEQSPATLIYGLFSSVLLFNPLSFPLSSPPLLSAYGFMPGWPSRRALSKDLRTITYKRGVHHRLSRDTRVRFENAWINFCPSLLEPKLFSPRDCICYSFERSGGEQKYGFVIQRRAIPLTFFRVYFVYIYMYRCFWFRNRLIVIFFYEREFYTFEGRVYSLPLLRAFDRLCRGM